MAADCLPPGGRAYPPGAFITVLAPEGRRLGLVGDGGTNYVDVVDYIHPAPALAILPELAPELWGDCRAIAAGMRLAGQVHEFEAFNALLLALCDTPAGGDPLTLNRAARWALEARLYQVEDAALAGLAATAEAARSYADPLARFRLGDVEARIVLARAQAHIRAMPGLDGEDAIQAYADQLCRDAGVTV